MVDDLDLEIPENHSINLRFLWAVDGKVVPSGMVFSVRDRVAEDIYHYLIDVWSAMREETPEGKNAESLKIPKKKIRKIIITHSHTDHCGDIARAVQQNPEAGVIAPEGNKSVISIIAHEAHKRSEERNIVGEIENWRRECLTLIQRIEIIERKMQRGVQRGAKWRTEKTRTHDQKKHDSVALELQLERTEDELWYKLWLKQHSIIELLEMIGKEDENPQHYTVTSEDLRQAISNLWTEKMHRCAEQGIVSTIDVDKAVNKIVELPMNTRYKVGAILRKKWQHNRDITITMKHSGHTQIVPSAQVYFEVPGKNGTNIGVLFSGDRGNSQFKAPYAQADDSGLENKADVLVLEATYGDRVHGNREEELQRLDHIVSEAIEKWEDIILPTISLDRPMMVMFEIVRRLLIKTDGTINDKLAAKVDISYFGVMIDKLLQIAKGRKHPMEKEIRRFWGLFHDTQNNAQKKKLAKKWPKTRIMFAGGGFLPKNWSPAGAILEYALDQDDINVLFPNYHGGPGSNADNLIQWREFLLTKENPNLRKLSKARWQKWEHLRGFSGHEDAPGLVSYARKVIRKWGTIYLNHGSEEARQALYLRLINDPIIKEKKIKVVLPNANQDYLINPNWAHTEIQTHQTWDEKKISPKVHAKKIAPVNRKKLISHHSRR